jgi:hypothetical protein
LPLGGDCDSATRTSAKKQARAAELPGYRFGRDEVRGDARAPFVTGGCPAAFADLWGVDSDGSFAGFGVTDSSTTDFGVDDSVFLCSFVLIAAAIAGPRLSGVIDRAIDFFDFALFAAASSIDSPATFPSLGTPLSSSFGIASMFAGVEAAADVFKRFGVVNLVPCGVSTFASA